ncbi:MAG: alpha/beta hydrolase [Oscillatoria sp. SIO1A7]|nr:alpha/beta hydrolase [Oscillatoria sp. SIO1A7]
MFPTFLPSEAQKLTESTSIDLARSIQRAEAIVPLSRKDEGRKDEAETEKSQKTVATAYVRQGEGGTPILLLHGFDSSVLEFRRLLPLLAAENETYAMDLLGFGFTDRTAGTPFDPPTIKTHLYSFWKTLINRPVTLVAASMGGAAAIDFTLSHPDAVEKLVLIDSAGFAKEPISGNFLFPPLDYLAAQFLRNSRVRVQVSFKAYQDKSLVTEDANICASLHLKMPGWIQATRAFAKSGGYGFVAQTAIAKIDKPTLILWGDADGILGTTHARSFEETIPDSQLIWIENCGHIPHLEQPQITAQHILKFI